MAPKTHLLPDDNQDNERDNDNHQQHQHRCRHRELRTRGWGQERDEVENFLSYSGAESGKEGVETDWDCLTAGREVLPLGMANTTSQIRVLLNEM